MKASGGARPLAAAALMAVGCLWLCGCERLILAVPAEVGMAVVEERSVVDAIDDLTIRVALNDVFIREDAELYRAVSFSVVEGRVLLKGGVPAPEDRERAVALSKGVAGVREVIDELQVGAGGGTLSYVRDGWISAQLKARLVLDLSVLHVNYDIETVNGVVYLIGIAQDEEELASVMGHARAIPDVRRVANHVMIKRHPRRLPRARDRRGRRTRAWHGNAAFGFARRARGRVREDTQMGSSVDGGGRRHPDLRTAIATVAMHPTSRASRGRQYRSRSPRLGGGITDGRRDRPGLTLVRGGFGREP